MIQKLLIVSTAVITISAGSLSAQTTIERLAPENSVLIVGTKNAQTLMDHFKATGLWSLWQSDKLKTLRAEEMKQITEGMNKMFQDLGVEEDSLVPPSGAAGVAVFSALDPELGTPHAAFIVTADYGANADKTDKLVQAALARGEKDKKIAVDQKDVGGRTIYTIDASKIEEKEQKKFDDIQMGDENNPMMPMPNPDEMMKGLKTLHYVRNGSSLLISSDMNTLTEALDKADGKGAHNEPGLADRADFQAVMSKIGEPDIYGIILTRDVMSLASGADPMGMSAMVQPIVRSVFGEVQGYGLGLRFDGPTAMVEQNLTVYMPHGKQGLTTLIDAPSARSPLPPFVGQDAVSYSSFNFAFSRVMETVHKIVSSNPMLQAQVGPQLPQIEEEVGPIMAALGTHVHIATSASKPYSTNTRKFMVAIECAKPQEFENAIAPMAAQFGLEARDFLGQRVYSMNPQAMMPGMTEPLSIGIGGGFVIIGQTPAVEQGLRASSQTGAGGLTSDKAFQRALMALPKDNVIAWGYSNTVDSIEAAILGAQASAQKQIEDIRKDDAEEADAMQAALQKQTDTLKKFDFSLFREYIGPSVWQARSTEDGFQGTFYLLAADGGKKP